VMIATIKYQEVALNSMALSFRDKQILLYEGGYIDYCIQPHDSSFTSFTFLQTLTNETINDTLDEKIKTQKIRNQSDY
jgi:hypothetical protein